MLTLSNGCLVASVRQADKLVSSIHHTTTTFCIKWCSGWQTNLKSPIVDVESVCYPCPSAGKKAQTDRHKNFHCCLHSLAKQSILLHCDINIGTICKYVIL